MTRTIAADHQQVVRACKLAACTGRSGRGEAAPLGSARSSRLCQSSITMGLVKVDLSELIDAGEVVEVLDLANR